MFKVYLLRSIKDGNKPYVGLTIKEVKERLNEHNNGLSKYTKPFRPWKLVYYEIFYCKVCAEEREKFLKSGMGFKIREHLLLLDGLVKENSSLKNGV